MGSGAYWSVSKNLGQSAGLIVWEVFAVILDSDGANMSALLRVRSAWSLSCAKGAGFARLFGLATACRGSGSLPLGNV